MTKERAIVATLGDMEGVTAGAGVTYCVVACVALHFWPKMEGNMLIANIDCTQKIYSSIKSKSSVPVF